MGVFKEERLIGKYGFRALFIGKYVCIYRISGEVIYIYHLADARTIVSNIWFGTMIKAPCLGALYFWQNIIKYTLCELIPHCLL